MIRKVIVQPCFTHKLLYYSALKMGTRLSSKLHGYRGMGGVKVCSNSIELFCGSGRFGDCTCGGHSKWQKILEQAHEIRNLLSGGHVHNPPPWLIISDTIAMLQTYFLAHQQSAIFKGRQSGNPPPDTANTGYHPTKRQKCS